MQEQGLERFRSVQQLQEQGTNAGACSGAFLERCRSSEELLGQVLGSCRSWEHLQEQGTAAGAEIMEQLLGQILKRCRSGEQLQEL